MRKLDKKVLLWMGAIFVAFAVVVARLMTGTWFGLLLAVGYALLWLSTLAPGLSDAFTASREEELEAQVEARDKEILKLRSELDTKAASAGAPSSTN